MGMSARDEARKPLPEMRPVRQLLPLAPDPVNPATLYGDLPPTGTRLTVRLNMIASIDGVTSVSGGHGTWSAMRCSRCSLAGWRGARRRHCAGETLWTFCGAHGVVSRSCRLDWDSPFWGGMSLFFAPVANVVLGSVRRDQEGIASGANNAIRELGGVLGIAVLGAVFSARGGYTSGAAFISGLSSAVWVGAAAVAAAAATALLLPRRRTAPVPAAAAEPVASPESAAELDLVG
jgi:hypothetical protein